MKRTAAQLRRLIRGAYALAAFLIRTGRDALATAAQQRAAWLRVELIRARAWSC